jgi:O-antigen/teichoic acid export membrane protein
MTDPQDASIPALQEPMVGVIARGGFWTIAGQMTGLGAALCATPFTLRLLGPSRYGVWALLQSAILWVALADFGMGGASTRFAGQAHATDDADGEATAIWTAAWISLVATAIVAAAAAVFAPNIADGILHVHSTVRSSAIVGLRIVALGVLFTTAMGILNTPLQVRLQYRTLALITQGFAILQVIAIPVFLELVGGGVTTAAIISTATSGLALVAVLAVGIRVQPAMRRPRFSRREARRLVTFGGALTVAGVADIPLTTAERLFLGHYRSSIQVAYYTVASRLAMLASAVPAAASQPLFPAVIRLQARGESKSARELYSQILQGSVLVLTPLLLLVALMARPFLSLWAGHVYAVHGTTACFLLLVGVWFQALSWLPLTYLMAIDKGGTVARARVLEIVPYLVAAALLTMHFGVLGAAIAWSARSVVDSLVFFIFASRSAGLPFSPLTERTMRALALPCLLAVGVVVLTHATSGLPARAGLAVGLLGVYLAAEWALVLAESERAVMRRLASQLSPRRRPA